MAQAISADLWPAICRAVKVPCSPVGTGPDGLCTTCDGRGYTTPLLRPCPCEGAAEVDGVNHASDRDICKPCYLAGKHRRDCFPCMGSGLSPVPFDLLALKAALEQIRMSLSINYSSVEVLNLTGKSAYIAADSWEGDAPERIQRDAILCCVARALGVEETTQ